MVFKPRSLASNPTQYYIPHPKAGNGAGHTFLLVMLRSSSALLRRSPWLANSRSSSTWLSRSSCWNSKSSKSFVSVSSASASLKDNDRGGWIVLKIPL